MSVREILDETGKIDPSLLPASNIPTLSSRQLLSGDNGVYVVVGSSPGSAGNVLATVPITPSNPSGLAFQPGASITLTRGQLITASSSNSTTALDWPGNDPNSLGAVLTVDPMADTGLKYDKLSTLIVPVPPLEEKPGEDFGFPAGSVRLDLGYTPGIAGKGQIPVGKNTILGGEGGLLSLPVGGPLGQVLTTTSDPTFGIGWTTLPPTTVTAGTNITVTGGSTIAVSNPLSATLNVGTQDITGTTGQLLLTDTGNTSQTTVNASFVSVADTATAGLSSLMSELGVSVSSGANNASLNSTQLIKNSGTAALKITHSQDTGQINLETFNGNADVTTNCALAPSKIRATNGLGSANQVLSAGAAGGSLTWVTPTPIPPTPGITAVLTAGNINTSSNYLDMGSQQIKNVSNPSATQDAATKNYVDARTLAQILGNSTSAGTKQITDVVDPTSAQAVATKNYVDTQFTPYTVKSLTGGTGISVSNSTGNWTISNTSPTEPLTTTLAAGNSAGSNNINMNNNRINNCNDPLVGTDVANKNYVDNSFLDYQIKSLTAGANITITPTANPKQFQIAAATTAGGIAKQAFYVFVINEPAENNGNGSFPVALSGGLKNGPYLFGDPTAGGVNYPAGEAWDFMDVYPQNGAGGYTFGRWACYIGGPASGSTFNHYCCYKWYDYPPPSGGIPPIFSNDSNISFSDEALYSSSSDKFITYTGTGRVLITLSATEVIFTSTTYIEPITTTFPIYSQQSVFNQNTGNSYYQSGVFLACGVLPGSTPGPNKPTNNQNVYVKPDLVGTSQMLGPGSIIDTAKYQGTFTATFEVGFGDNIFLYPYTNGYFNYDGSDPVVDGFTPKPSYSYAFELQSMELKMHVLRLED